MSGRRPPSGTIADYLRLKYRQPLEGGSMLAGLLGLSVLEREQPSTPQGDNSEAISQATSSTGAAIENKKHPYPDCIPPLPFVRHLGCKPKQQAKPEQMGKGEEAVPKKPGLFKKKKISPAYLQPWPVLWPFLKKVLSESSRSHQPDLKKLIAKVGANQPIHRIPFRSVDHWPQEMVVIIDASDHLAPVQHDFFMVVERLWEWFPQRLTLLINEQSERAEFIQIKRGICSEHDDLPPLPEQAAVLVLSDLGQLHPQPWHSFNWLEWGRRIERRCGKALALIPALPGDWDLETVAPYRSSYFDYDIHPQIGVPRGSPAKQDCPGVAALNTLLGTMARITPAQLREARIRHPAGLTISDEIRFWSQLSLGATPHYKQWQDRDQQQGYIESLGGDETLVALAETLMRGHEKSLPLRLQIQQRQQFGAIKPMGLDPKQKHYLQHLVTHYQELEALESRFLNNWIALMEDRKGAEPWIEEVEPLYQLYYRQLPQEQRKGKIPPTDETVSPSQTDQPVEFIVCPEGELLRPEQSLSTSGEWCVASPGVSRHRHLIAHRDGANPERILKTEHHSSEKQWLPEKTGRLIINSDDRVDTFDWFSCPPWASGIGRDRYGLFVEVEALGVPFVMRWIPPGRFWMGSSDDEPERYDDEGPRQQITFERGFWLAETACTQALWQAVMGENPSRFKEDSQNPVENVGWSDARRFIETLNGAKAGFDFRLPSEAEWEYACRAGTETPFWFGRELSTEDANYDGNYPYNNGKKGEYREKTVPVKSFRPNPWGLYQMHGNVWEGCEDFWHGSHEGADPQGRPRPKGSSENHVFRGGSWIDCGWYLRAAYRNYWHIGSGSGGFRLARGPESSSWQGAGAALRWWSEGRAEQPQGSDSEGAFDED